MIRRRRLGAWLATLTTTTAGIVVAAAPQALAVTCPTGSVTWNTENDVNGNQIAQNADNFGTGADTCFTTGTNGEFTITQADPAFTSLPTSYPDNGYGCGASYCTTRWVSELWSTPAIQLTGSTNTTNMAPGTNAALLVDDIFTVAGGAGQPTAAEVEIVSWAAPSYSALGYCASTACGATPVTIHSETWWRSERKATNGWPVWYYVRATMKERVQKLGIGTFLTNANCTGFSGGLGNLRWNQVAFGDELWANGLGIQMVSTSATGIP
jgi:hypothetical protein